MGLNGGALLLAAMALVAGLAGCSSRDASSSAGGDADIRWTEYGIPHITADDWHGLGLGYGYAEARDELCTLADGFVTVNAQRSFYFGEDASYGMGGPSLNATHTFNNLDSDLFFTLYHADSELLKPVDLSDPRVAALAAGYVDGYNHRLTELGPTGLPQECRGAAWVRPITVTDLVYRGGQLQLFKSLPFLTGMANAVPPGSEVPGQAPILALADIVEPALGSNAIAVGKEASASGAGILFGNPHFPWQGMQRLHETHITIPGEVDAFGVGLLGFPMPLIGFTNEFAWSHTVSTNWPFTIYELNLVAGLPTTYLVDGVPTEMEARTVSVQATTADGQTVERSRTFYLTRYGPVLEYGLVQAATKIDSPIEAGLSWTPLHAYAMRDANAQNNRMAQQWLEVLTADSFDEFLDAIQTHVANPWTNTIAASRDGRAYYGMQVVAPNLTPEEVDACMVPIGQALYQLARLPILDGSGTACDWHDDPSAPQAGILPSSRLPGIEVADYVMNANDSHWVPNRDIRLEGFSKFVGAEAAALSPRTRMGFELITERLTGNADCTIEPSIPCNLFTPLRLEALIHDERTFLADDVVPALTAQVCPIPRAVGSQGQVVDLQEACSALAAWDGSNGKDTPGLLLFERFWATAPQNWLVPFDAADPFTTPSGYVAADPRVRVALADAVIDLESSGIAVDATQAEGRQIVRNAERFTFPGAAGAIGSYSVMTWPFTRGEGYGQGIHGNSYMQVVTWDENGPVARAIVSYSQSEDPSSAHYADQTALYARQGWVDVPFRSSDVKAATLERIELSP